MILILVGCLAASLAALSACGSDDDDGAGAGTVTVAATTGILANITSEVAGEDADVVQIVPDNASPHDFQPSAEDRQELVEADLVTYNAAGLDAAVPVDEADAPTWALAENVPDLLPFAEEGEHSGEEDEHTEEEEHAEEEDEHGSDDPHVWMDPTRVAAALPALADALADVDPGNARAYRERASDYADRLEAIDREVARRIDSVPPDDRELVTSHDALGYFADRYGLEVVATPFPATGAEAEASADSVAEVIDVVNDTDTHALFAEETDDPEVLDSIANETGATVVDNLLVEAPGSAGTYAEMLRHDGELIASSLQG
jgi:zinc/manganese transport system substrate-binding protein